MHSAAAAPRPSTARALLADVALPFALSRALLLLAAWYATQFAPSWTYFLPAAATRGWTYVASLPLDVWARYDTVWYLDLAWNGYRPPEVQGWQSNLAFFPLYPLLARAAYALVPAGGHGFTALYLCALAVANLAALAGLAAAWAWVRAAFGDDALARRAVLLLLLFPGGFFLSCAYSESVFLAASALSMLALERRRPWAAGAAGLVAALARPTGVLLAAAIVLHRRWTSTPTSTSTPTPTPTSTSTATPTPTSTATPARWWLPALLPPLGLALHAANLWRVTGDPLALFHAQAAWGRGVSVPWAFLLDRPGLHPWTAPLDRAAILLFLALGIALWRAHRAAAAYVLLSLVPIVLSGTPMSATRLVAVLFPAFVPLARLAGRERAGLAIAALFAAIQVLLFAAWSRFHWVA